MKAFTFTFDQFNLFLLNKINKKSDPKRLNDSVYGIM